MKYIIKIKDEDTYKVALDHSDHIYADVDNAVYVAKSEATRFLTYEEAKKNLMIYEEVMEVSQ